MKVYNLTKFSSSIFSYLAALALFAILLAPFFLNHFKPAWLPQPLQFPGSPPLFFSVLLGCAIFALVLFMYLRTPYAITWMDDNSLEFRGPVRSTRVPVNKIISIKSGRPGYIRIEHRHGSISIPNRITGFHEFIYRIKNLNPKVEIDGWKAGLAELHMHSQLGNKANEVVRVKGTGVNEQIQRLLTTKVYKTTKSVLFSQLIPLTLFTAMLAFLFLMLLRPTWLPRRFLSYNPPPLLLVLATGAIVAWLLFAFLWFFYAVSWIDDNSLVFRSFTRKTRVPVNEITSIKAMTLDRDFIKIKHHRGSVCVLGQISDLYELIYRIKNLNPEVENKGC